MRLIGNDVFLLPSISIDKHFATRVREMSRRQREATKINAAACRDIFIDNALMALMKLEKHPLNPLKNLAIGGISGSEVPITRRRQRRRA